MSDITWSTVQLRLGDLIEWEHNPVTLSKHDAAEIKKSIDKFGLVLPLVANAPLEGGVRRLIDGHQRKAIMLMAKQAGKDTMVDVRVPSRPLEERECDELSIRLRRNVGEWSWDLLANTFDLPDLLEWGFEKDELLGKGFEMGEGAAPEAQIDKAAALQEKWQVKVGDVWEVGRHRIACGDCTDKAVVEMVMQGEKADLWLTDPPYGKLKIFAEGTVIGVENVAKRRFYNPEYYQGEGDFRIEPVLESTKDRYVKAVIWGGNYFADVLPITTAWLVWDKRAGERAFFSDCELAWSNLPTGARVFTFAWQGMIRAGNHEERLHPTQKPPELMEWILRDLQKDALVVLDTFLGSGTTLVAAERLGRIGRGIEISPPYVSVCLERLSDMGLEPRLLDNQEGAKTANEYGLQ